MTTTLVEAGTFTEDAFARNLIGGQWVFPSAPFEYEIRSPVDSEIIATVPLSSRLDVRAAAQAGEQGLGQWMDEGRRGEVARALLALVDQRATDLASVQSRETGLSTEDSAAGVQAVRQLVGDIPVKAGRPGRVTGHILCWGMPLLDAAVALLPGLFAGDTAVVKPSLRAPLSATALIHLVQQAGAPAGTVNLVLGLGLDVGAAIIAEPLLSRLIARGSTRMLQVAQRSLARQQEPVIGFAGADNVVVAGPDARLDDIVAIISEGVTAHAVGGPLATPLLAVHQSLADTVVEALVAGLQQVRPAPSTTDHARHLTRDAVMQATAQGATVRAGGDLPDDRRHRMGWFLPPVLLDVGHVKALPDISPPGPVVSLGAWRDPADLAAVFDIGRRREGVAVVLGSDQGAVPDTIVRHTGSTRSALREGVLPDGWGGVRRGQ